MKKSVFFIALLTSFFSIAQNSEFMGNVTPITGNLVPQSSSNDEPKNHIIKSGQHTPIVSSDLKHNR